MLILFKLLIGISILLLISYLFSFILLIKNKDIKYNLTYRFTLGSILFVTIFSLIITMGQSMMILAIPTLFFIIYFQGNNSINVNNYKLNYLAFVIFLLIAITISFINIQGIDFNGMKVPINDQSYYVSIVNSIEQTNQESSISYLKDYYHYNKYNLPYHYYEYWLAIFVRYVTKWNNHLILNGVVTGFSLLLIFLNIYNLLKSFMNQKLYLIVIGSVLFMFLRGLIHYIPNVGQSFSQATDSIFFDGNQKLIYVLPFFLLALSEFFKTNQIRSLQIFLLIPVVNIVFLPSIIGGICLFLAYLFLINIKQLKSIIIKYKHTVISIVLFVFTLLFYFKFIALNLRNTSLVSSVGGIFYNVLDNGLKWLIINSILFVVILFFAYKYRKFNVQFSIFILLLCFTFSGLFGFALTDTNQNAWQIYATISRFTSIGFYMYLLYILKNHFKTQTIALYSMLVLSVFMFIENYKLINHLPLSKISSYTTEYITQISKHQFKNKVGIKIVNPDTRPNLQRNPVYAGICNYLALTENAISTVIINTDELLPNRIIENDSSYLNTEVYKNNQLADEIFVSPFFIYSNFQKSIISKKEIELKQINFVNHYQPEFCVVEKGKTLPDFLKNKIINSYQDKGTGETFYILSK